MQVPAKAFDACVAAAEVEYVAPVEDTGAAAAEAACGTPASDMYIAVDPAEGDV